MIPPAAEARSTTNIFFTMIMIIKKKTLLVNTKYGYQKDLVLELEVSVSVSVSVRS